MINAVRNKPKNEAVTYIASEIKYIINKPMDPSSVRAISEKIKAKLNNMTSLNTSKKAKIEKAIIDSGIDLPRTNYVSDLAAAIINIVKKQDNKSNVELEDIDEAIIAVMSVPMTNDQLLNNAERIYNKLVVLTGEYIKWTEILFAILIAFFMYHMPIIVFKFQRKMRSMEMEDEVMQFQTLILMLMHIERVSVEYIIEWLERFAHIFKEPLSTCLNNYESGAWESLEQLKEDAPFKPFVRIVESLQSAVENVRITDAFDELETERAFFQEKRKEANERLINKKSRIGKFIGFTPMVFLFVVYLIIPLMWVSIGDMGSYFTQMSSML